MYNVVVDELDAHKTFNITDRVFTKKSFLRICMKICVKSTVVNEC